MTQALALRRDLDVDVVVLDHRMPGLTGLETASQMLAEAPDLPIVLYSAFTDERMNAEARRDRRARVRREGRRAPA